MNVNLRSERRKLALVVTPGLNGFRLAFAAGDYFEPIAEFATLEEARAALTAALAVTRQRAT